MKIALIQMKSSSDLDSNLKIMERLTQQAARSGARVVVFPEMAYFTAPLVACSAVQKRFDELLGLFATWAKRHSLCLIPGTLREPGPSKKHFNTLPVLGPKGLIAKYRKIFLFKATLPDRRYDESVYTDRGEQVVTFEFEGVTFGTAICYDLRFPEVFRALKKKGAQVVVVPSAFTVPTGRAHWEILIRARAIENQVYVAAPGLAGRSGNGARTYGHSLIVDPWGKVKAKAKRTNEILLFRWDSTALSKYQACLDAWDCRREDLFPFK